MRSALQIRPDLAAQGTNAVGKWAGMPDEIRVPTQEVVETVTANAVRNIPYPKNRMLIAPVISREVAKGSWLVKKLDKPRLAKTIEVRWAHFIAKQLAERDALEATREAPMPPLDSTLLAGLTSFAIPLGYAGFVGTKERSIPRELLDIESRHSGVWSRQLAQIETVYEEPFERNDTASFFVPSDELVALWVAGMNEHIQEVGGDEIKVEQAQNSLEFKHELALQLHKIINNFAKRKAYESGRYRITFGRNLYPSVEGLISDHLMLPPRNAVPFLNELTRLLYSQSSPQPIFKGRWGALIVDGSNELVLDLVKRKSRRLQGLLKG